MRTVLVDTNIVLWTFDGGADFVEALQEVADSWQGEFAEPKVTITPQQLEGDISTVTDDDYADKVDTFVGNMAASDDNVFTHDSEGC